MAEPKKKSDAKKPVAAEPKAEPTKKSDAPPSKFAAFIAERKLDPRRILIASKKLEANRPEDRAIRLAKRLARGREGGEGAPKETRKPRSGRPVTGRALQAAMKGGDISGPTKTRILRAVNHLLEQKKQELVDLRSIF
jgi:hypothetical protein